MKPTDVDLRQLQDAAGAAQKRLTKTASVAAVKARKVAAMARATMVERLPRREEIPPGRDADGYGDIDWEKADRAVAMASGLLASLVDTALVGTPTHHDSRFLRWPYPGSPLTRWLHPARYTRAERWHDKYGHGAPVPYDAGKVSDTDGKVTGLHPSSHRLQGIGHDPFVGFIVGVRDLMRGEGTYYNKDGERVMWAPEGFRAVGRGQAVRTQFLHLLSDVGTATSLPPPLFSLLQIGQIQSPFALEAGGEKVRWTDVSRHMYRRGYDMRHFVAMAIVPGIVEVNIRGYWLLTANMRSDKEGGCARLASMLLMGHTVAVSGNLLKTGFVFGMNPAALNWAQLLAMPLATVAWIIASALPDARTRGGPDEEQRRLTADPDELARPRQDAPPA